MPLLKRKPFPLLEIPDDLKPNENVYQVRFTKEIIRNYREYIHRLYLYRQRVWTCKLTGKTKLTYEEALVSEKNGSEMVQHFPKELMTPILRTVQFSLLPMHELINAIREGFKDRLKAGDELVGKKDDRVCLCKVVRVVEQNGGKRQYEVEWIGNDGKVMGKSMSDGDDLVRKKLPFSREALKSFIRRSTRQNAPWVLHDELAKEHSISLDLPRALQSDFVCEEGNIVRKKRKKEDDAVKYSVSSVNGFSTGKNQPEITQNKAQEPGTEDKAIVRMIKYPMDDLLVRDESVLATRPVPSRTFAVPMECVGDLLMVWDFFSSFARLLSLSPFSLEDFESAVCHKGIGASAPALLAESHSSVLRLLTDDDGGESIRGKKRRQGITTANWTEHLCDFLDTVDDPELSSGTAMIRRGHYGLLDARVKLRAMSELVLRAVETAAFRKKLDENIGERQTIGATRRCEVLEEARRKRECRENSKDPSAATLANGHSSPSSPLSLHTDPASESDRPKNKRSRERSQDKVFHTEQRKEYYERELEKCVIRSSTFGRDHDHNRYWFFGRDWRVFVEKSNFNEWGYYGTKEELDAFMSSLNTKGVREMGLHKQFTRHYDRICRQMSKRFKEVRSIEAEEMAVRRSSRVKALPKVNRDVKFLQYENKWKDE